MMNQPIEVRGSVRVEPVRTRYRHVVHAYAAIPAWDRRNERLLYVGFDDVAQGDLVVQHLADGREQVIATVTGFDFHTAASQRWVLNDSAVLFRTGTDKEQTMMVPADGSAPPRPLELAPRLGIRHVCDDSAHFTGTAQLSNDEKAIVLGDLDAGSIRPLTTLRDVVAGLPRELVVPDVISYEFSHPVANPQLTCLFFKLMRRRAQGTRFAALFTLDLTTGALTCLGDRISGHPVWMPDGQHILNVMSPRDGSDNRWLVYQHAGTGEVTRVVDLPMEGPGHPTLTPDGRYIATDAFTADGQSAPIYLIDAQARAAREVARLPHRFIGGPNYDPSQVTRGQPHPVWSHHPIPERQLLVHCNQAGQRMRLFILSNLWAD